MSVIEKTAIEAVTEQFRNYGEYVCLNRHIPYIFDGLKPSYRRVIQTAFEIAKDKKVKAATIVGTTISRYHPHSSVSLEPIVAELVNYGVFEGQGNFGYQGLMLSSGPAASRYVEAQVAPNYAKLLTPIIKYVPKFDNELGYKECMYLPTPIPFTLVFGALGIGIGTGTRIPSFTPRSILEAYLKDDPELLRNFDGLVIDNPKDLKKLWNEGRGCIKYHINNYVNGDRITVEGKPGFIKPKWNKLFSWRDDGRVDYDDESGEMPKISFFKMPRVSYPSFEEIQTEVERAVKDQESYYIRVVYNKQVRDIGIKDWIDITYNNYKDLLEKYKNDKIQNLEFDILTFNNFRRVADILINDEKISYEDVASKFNIPIEVVNVISQKSIHQLRTADPKNKVKKLEEEIKEFKKLNSDNYIKDAIDTMSESISC